MARLEIPVKVDLDEIDKLIDELRHLQTYKLYEGADQKLVDIDEVVKIFAGHVKAEGEQSTIEPERKRGEWIHGKELSRIYIGDACVGIDYEDFHCSVCNVVVEEPCKPAWKYCPNCGAEMST